LLELWDLTFDNVKVKVSELITSVKAYLDSHPELANIL
jgi:hypothetical protein